MILPVHRIELLRMHSFSLGDSVNVNGSESAGSVSVNLVAWNGTRYASCWVKGSLSLCARLLSGWSVWWLVGGVSWVS